jgi:methyl-accepting chemotaxis protein
VSKQIALWTEIPFGSEQYCDDTEQMSSIRYKCVPIRNARKWYQTISRCQLRGAVVAALLSWRIGGSVTSILGQADAIAEGDLTRADVRVISADELGELTAAVDKM